MKTISLTACALCLSLTAVASAQPHTFTANDLKSIATVSDAQISPNGKSIAYIVSRANYTTDKRARTLMLVDVATGAQRVLVADRDEIGDPAWSPDGTQLGFVAMAGSGKSAHEQVYVLPMSGGDASVVTNAPRGIEQFAWRPDGQAIAYVTPDAAPNAKAIAAHLDGFVVGDQSYTSMSAPTPNHIWLATRAATGTWTARRLTHGTWSLPTAQPPGPPASPLSWSPDGRSIAFDQMPNAYDADGYLAHVAILDTQTGAIRALTAHGKYESVPEYSPDGTHIAYWYPFGGDPAAENDIFVSPASGGNGTDTTTQSIDTNVVRALWMPGSQSLLIAGHKGTDAALWIQSLDGTAKRIALGDVQPNQFFWLDAGVSTTGAIAFTGSTPRDPSALYYLASPAAVPQQMTHYNDAIEQLDLGRVAPIAWNSDGFAQDGVVTYPPNYDPAKTYPLVLVIHGGPNYASIASFSAFNQLLAARGWIVFNPNYRGSDNLGEKYWYGIVKDAGAGPGRDVMAGIAALERSAHIDRTRIGVSGWSYGGYMTSWLIGHYHIWKAAVSGAAVNNLVDEYDLSDGAGAGEGFMFGGSPYVGNNMALYRAESPITYAWDITTPTLILSDTSDSRVPNPQSYEMYHALTDHHVPTQFWAYPVAGHFPSDAVRQLDVDTRWIDWLAQYLK